MALISFLLGVREYPIAAPLVIANKLVFADYEKKTLSALATPGLIPVSADMDRFRKTIVFSAREGSGQAAHLYILTLTTGAISRVDTGIAGDHQVPRFSHDAKLVFFAASDEFPGSPLHPTKTRLMDLASMQLRPLPKLKDDDRICEFAPVPLGQETAHIATNCYVGFQLRAKGINKATQRTVEIIDSPTAETATSFDGTRLVYTLVDSGGTHILMKKGGGVSRELLRLDGQTSPIQPHFICPRDLMFAVGSKPVVLNTDTGATTDVQSSPPIDGGSL